MLALTAGSGASNGTESYDVVIANGRVMDPESRLDAVRNVGVRGGKIVVISTAPLEGKQSIDARSLVVAPGFIDLHQHGQDAENYAAKAADGVTTALELEVGVADVCTIRAGCCRAGTRPTEWHHLQKWIRSAR